MMQIYDDALDASRESNTKYVLSKSLDMTMCEYGKGLLKYLKDGWDIKGRFHNGTGYESYIIENVGKDAAKIKSVIKTIGEMTGVEPPERYAVILSFQMFYNKSNKLEGINLNVETLEKGSTQAEDKFYFVDDDAEKIRDLLINILFVKQDKRGLIIRLEKEFAE